VQLTYVDESFTNSRYLIAALLVPDVEAASLGAALDTVVWDAMSKHGGVSSQAELHGYDLVAGKRDWAPLAQKVRARIGVYDDALQAIAAHNVRIVIRSVDIVRLKKRYASPDHPHSIVMTHLLERIDECCGQEPTLVIADEVDGQDGFRRDLWHYQRGGTWGYRSRKIKNVVDTIHFAPSSASRLVQGADMIAYIARRRATHTEADARAEAAWSLLWSRIQPKIVHNGCWWP
jgi:hypothetical protein